MFLICANCASTPKPPPVAVIKKTANGSLYHRFYQGYRLESVNTVQFEEIINTRFLPLFALAHPYGLYSYRPALLTEVKGCTLPAEIALLTFTDEQIYAKYRETEIGRKIRDAHGLVFESKTSNSLVPESYAGNLELDRAYNLKTEFKDYQDSYTALLVYCQPRSEKNLLSKVQKIYKTTNARNILFTVGSKHLAEYIFASSAAQLKAVSEARMRKFSGIYKKSMMIDLDKQKIGSSPVKMGQGVDAQW